MQYFRLLIAAASLFLSSVVALEKATTCERSLNVHILSCELGVVRVQSALYGRADTETCNEGRPPQQIVDTQCSLQGTEELVRKRCDGKKTCELNIKDVATSDPCTGTFKYLETKYICAPALRVIACEGSSAHLECYSGQIIFVYGADYGRRDRNTCAYKRPNGQVQNIHCSNPTSKVAESCNGKNNCSIQASNSKFGDPCGGTYKYLEVAYICEYPLEAPSPSSY